MREAVPDSGLLRWLGSRRVTKTHMVLMEAPSPVAAVVRSLPPGDACPSQIIACTSVEGPLGPPTYPTGGGNGSGNGCQAHRQAHGRAIRFHPSYMGRVYRGGGGCLAPGGMLGRLTPQRSLWPPGVEVLLLRWCALCIEQKDGLVCVGHQTMSKIACREYFLVTSLVGSASNGSANPVSRPLLLMNRRAYTKAPQEG